MPKTFIASLGFDQSSLIRLIGEKGLSINDKIYLVTSAVSHPKTENAIKSIVDFVRAVNPGIGIEVLRLNEADLENNVAKLSIIISNSDEPIIDITGGPKGISLSLFLAACFSGVRKVYMTTETLGERVEMPTLAMPASVLTDRQREALEALPCRVTELSRKLGVSKSTASRLLKNLMKKGLVHKNEDKKIFELTLTGKILLRIAKIKASSLIA